MTPRRNIDKAIDSIISGLEEEILHASDDEILEDTGDARHAAAEVRTLIDQQIRARSHGVPNGLTARRSLLAEILRARPSLAPAMSATFSDGRNPSEDEVNDLIETLLRIGVLHNSEK